MMQQNNTFREEFFKSQLERIQASVMTEKDWLAAQERYRLWAVNNGFVPKSEALGTATKEEQAFRRMELLVGAVEKIPDKMTANFEMLLTRLASGFEKMAELQERRELQRERRLLTTQHPKNAGKMLDYAKTLDELSSGEPTPASDSDSDVWKNYQAELDQV